MAAAQAAAAKICKIYITIGRKNPGQQLLPRIYFYFKKSARRGEKVSTIRESSKASKSPCSTPAGI